MVDPGVWEQQDIRAALAVRDIGAVYRALVALGLSQSRIATLTGQRQSDVSEIIKGRVVKDYRLLERIAEGLGIPREYMGLSYGEGTYSEEVMVTDPEGVEALLRRHLLAQCGIVITGATVAKLGALLAKLPAPPPVTLPSRLDYRHVTQVQDMTRRLGLGETFTDPETTSAAAELASRLLDVPGPEPVRRDLMIAVAELHGEAGWAAHDAGLGQCALYHHARSLDLATDAGDIYLQVMALRYSGLILVEQGHPDEGLKLLQVAQIRTWDIPRSDHRAVIVGVSGRAAAEACALQESATALARLGELNTAVTTLAKGRDLWTPAPTDPFGDMDRPAARLELARGRLDAAEQFAAASVRRWTGGRQLSRTLSGAVLATVHVKAGDSRGLPLARQTITDVSKLRSVRTRQQWLLPLADELDTRPGSDHRDLARMARQVAATRT